MRNIFYDVPTIECMIAASQLVLAKQSVLQTIRAPPDRSARKILTACCNNQRLVGRPQLHNKNFMVHNIRLLFARLPTTNIDRHGSLKDWINEASNEAYWNQLIQCLLHSDASLPERPVEWGPFPQRAPDILPPRRRLLPHVKPPMTVAAPMTDESPRPPPPNEPPPSQH